MIALVVSMSLVTMADAAEDSAAIESLRNSGVKN